MLIVINTYYNISINMLTDGLYICIHVLIDIN